ncbi:CRISPR-associated protein Csx19 [Chroococcus sp. FPU101]|uniref:type III-D CRISPR-associated protein Csx19 n=1 Tax=Chroococcus sp. FPU101 TaxID=1974212 RepID=UPI001A8EE7CD|nr:CRISPR-associated protein Csx19 [Chroococcus sp. FPU101]GFE68269.1 CRISPR-associated protein [Chroococcus sp. FPU101]
MNKPDCVPLEDAKNIVDTKSLNDWLQNEAKQHQLTYLLAHADDGVIWGRFESDGTLITQTEPKDLFSEYKFAKLRLCTLQQCRIFSKKAEILLWKVGQNWKARLITDDHLLEEDYIYENQILWGTKGIEKDCFTLVSDGSQGLKHAVPLTGIVFKDETARPLRLSVRNYIDYNDDGVARIYLSRIVNVYYQKEIKK